MDEHPHDEPAVSAAPSPAPAPTPATDTHGPGRLAVGLPWTLVAVLTLAVVILGNLLVKANQQLAAAQPGTNAAATAPSSQDPEVARLLTSLARRDPDDPLARGRVDAPVVLIEWADWRCPYCAQWARETEPALEPYIASGSLRIEFRDLALFGDESIAAARGARAAGKQGRFWEYYRAVFDAAPTSGHATITDADVLAFAKTAGVPDLARFTKDYGDPAILAAVMADTKQAQQIGLDSTPFFVVNTTPISGAQPLATFVSVIESYGGKR